MQTIYLSFVFVITNASEPDTTGCYSVPDRFIVLFRPQFKCRRVVNQNSRASFHGLDSVTEFSNPIFQPSFIDPFFCCPVFQLFFVKILSIPTSISRVGAFAYKCNGDKNISNISTFLIC